MSAIQTKAKTPERFEPAASRLHGISVDHCAIGTLLNKVELLNIYACD